jgi:hypothetical protein
MTAYGLVERKRGDLTSFAQLICLLDTMRGYFYVSTLSVSTQVSLSHNIDQTVIIARHVPFMRAPICQLLLCVRFL